MLAVLPLQARKKDKIETIKPSVKSESTFAIVVDNLTWKNCAPAIRAYRDVLQEEGLGTFIFAANWSDPMNIRELLKKTWKRNNLEGAVLVGDIPVVRVQGAQHMTTAFKQEELERMFPRIQSWAATDRFYDDFDLDFRPEGRDTTDLSVFFYHLTDRGAQRLSSDIYSARMQVPEIMPGDKYQILSDYLAEVVSAHKEVNPLDNVIYYQGVGYYSDNYTTWRQKPEVWKEYFPLAFESSHNNKFYNFRYSPTVKYQIFNELQRPETDLFQFSEHGDENVQYLSDFEDPTDLAGNLDALRRSLRSFYSRLVRNGGRIDEYLKDVEEKYHMGRDQFTQEKLDEDAAYSAKAEEEISIYPEDIIKLKSQPRVLIFNACYNGSYWYKEGYIAGCHIFNGGRSIVAQGNTTNVLQDKYEDELMGMLHLGYRIGQWQKKLPYLESHLIGDPTFRFTHVETEADANIRKAIEIRRMTDEALANGQSCSAALLEIFKTSKSPEVRLEALSCLYRFSDENCVQALMLAFSDPFERIQTLGCLYAGYVGDPRLEKGLLWVYETQDQNIRAQFQAINSLDCFTYRREINEEAIADAFDRDADFMDRNWAIRYLRNTPLHYDLDRLLAFVMDASQPEDLRVIMAEALGWFNHSYRRSEITTAFKAALSNKSFSASETLREEMSKTIRRIG